MQIKEKITKEEIYILNEKEVAVIKDCLRYVWHRIQTAGKMQHAKEGVEQLRKELGITEKRTEKAVRAENKKEESL